VGTSYGDGSVTGAGSSTAQSSANYNGTAGTVSPRARTTSSSTGTIGRRPPQRQQVRVPRSFPCHLSEEEPCPTKSYGGPFRRGVHVGDRAVAGIQHGADSGAAERRSKRSAGRRVGLEQHPAGERTGKLGGHRIQPALWNRNVNACDWNHDSAGSGIGSTYNMYFATASNAIQRHVYIDLQREFP